ncbi:MAG TPA: hypothetical protein VNO32_57545 [Candidatus Acidoferrum sp.]|jgi:hypothetical protein|nr:hypothetical protein [Candidatus Acidoferrum sp.]
MSRKSEMRIVRQAIGRLIATGYPIDVNNGEAIVLYASRDIKVIMSVLGARKRIIFLPRVATDMFGFAWFGAAAPTSSVTTPPIWRTVGSVAPKQRLPSLAV